MKESRLLKHGKQLLVILIGNQPVPITLTVLSIAFGVTAGLTNASKDYVKLALLSCGGLAIASIVSTVQTSEALLAEAKDQDESSEDGGVER